MNIDNIRVLTNNRELQNIRELQGSLLFNGPLSSNIVTLTDWDVDCAIGNNFKKVVTESGQFDFINLPTDGTSQIVLCLTVLNGDVSWANVKWSDNTTPTFDHNVAYVVVLTYIAATQVLIGSVIPGFDTGFSVDLTPDPFVFDDVWGVSPSTLVYSNQITVVGVDPNKLIVIRGTGCVVDAGTEVLTGTFEELKIARTSDTGTFVVQLQITSSDTQLDTISATIEVGGYTSVWKVTTRAVDITPVEFNIDPLFDQPINTHVTSPVITVSGLEPKYAFTIVAVDGLVDAGANGLTGTFQQMITVDASVTGTIDVQLQLLTSDFELTTTTMQVSVGDYSTTWDVQTKQIVQQPRNLFFPAVNNVKLNTLVRSQAVTISNLEPGYPVTVSAINGYVDAHDSLLTGSYSTSKTVRASSTGTIIVRCEQQSSNNPIEQTSANVIVGGASTTWNVTTKSIDTTPTFTKTPTDVVVEPDTLVISSDFIVSNLEPNYPITVSCSNGEFDINSNTRLFGQYKQQATVATSATGQLFGKLRARSSKAFATRNSVELSIGDGKCTWHVSTRPFKNTPVGLVIEDIANADHGVDYSSVPLNISGLEPNTSYTVSATGGTISAGKYSASTVFSTITQAVTTNDGTMVVVLKQKSSLSDSTTTRMVVDIGDTSAVWSITTRIRQTTPKQQNISRPARVVTEPSHIACSETISVVGLDPSIEVVISVVNGCFSDATVSNKLSFHAEGSVIASKQGTLQLILQGTSPSQFGQCKTVTAMIGGTPVEWIISTRCVTPTPVLSNIQITPPQLPGVPTPTYDLGAVVTSPPVVIDGLEPNYPVEVASPDGLVSSDGVNFVPSTTITTDPNGRLTFTAQQTTSATPNTTTTSTVTVDSQPIPWSVTSRPPKTTPVEFQFEPLINTTPCVPVTSETVRVTGLEPNFPIQIASSDGTVDGGANTLSGTPAKSKTVTTSSEGTLVVQATTKSPCCGGIPKSVNIQVGNDYAPWVVSAKAVDGTPDDFAFVDVIDAPFNSPVTSNTIVVGGLEPGMDVPVSNTNGTVDAGTNGLTGKFTPTKLVKASPDGTITVAARTTTADCCCGTTTATVSVGDKSTDWHVAPKPRPNVPTNLSTDFVDTENADLNSEVTSESIVISGLDPNYPIPFSAVGGTIDVGANGLSGTWGASKLVTPGADGSVTIAARQLSSNVPLTSKTMKVNVGTTTLDWAVKTKNLDSVPDSTALFDPILNAELNTRYTSNIATVIGLEPNTTFQLSIDRGELTTGTSTVSGTWGTSPTVKTDAVGSFVMQARQTTGGAYSASSPAVVTLAANKFSWDVKTRVPASGGVVPDFTDVVDAAVNATVTSNTIEIPDLEPNYNYTITASNGLVSAGATTIGNTFVPSTIVTSTSNGTIVAALQQTSSASLNTATTAALNIGSTTIDWKVTTTNTTNYLPGTIATGSTDLYGSETVGPDISYGCSVAIDGNTYVVGAKTESVYGAASGAAYVYVNDGQNWVFDIKLVPPAGEANDWFGAKVDISGDIIVVGAPTTNVNGLRDSGAAYVFVRTGATWAYQAKLIASDCNKDDQFGYKVCVKDGAIFISAYDYQVANSLTIARGAVYVFEFDSTNWTQTQKITNYEQTAAGNWATGFGCSVSSWTKDTVLIGVRGGVSSWGNAQLYKRTATGYIKDYAFMPTDLVARDNFGACVAINATYVAIGCPARNSDSGVIYLYQLSGTSWNQIKVLSVTGTSFGSTFALGDKYLYVGSAQTSTRSYGAPTGLSWVFDSSANWKSSKVMPYGSSNSTFFGSVDVFGNTLLASKTRNTTATTAADLLYKVVIKQL